MILGPATSMPDGPIPGRYAWEVFATRFVPPPPAGGDVSHPGRVPLPVRDIQHPRGGLAYCAFQPTPARLPLLSRRRRARRARMHKWRSIQQLRSEVTRDVTDPDNPNLKPQAPALRDSDVSTFRFFDVSTQKPPKTQLAPTHARHKCWHNSERPCVTICHLRFYRACARETKRLAGLPMERSEVSWRRPTSHPRNAVCHPICIHPQPLDPSAPRPLFPLFREPPQLMPGSRLTNAPANFFRLLSPWFVGESRPPDSAGRGKNNASIDVSHPTGCSSRASGCAVSRRWPR